MSKRERDEDFLALDGGADRKSKKQKKSDKDGKDGVKPQQNFAEFKAAAKEKKKMKQAIKRDKRENASRRQHPKNLAKYGDLPEQKAARKAAKKAAAEAREARLAAQNGGEAGKEDIAEQEPVDEAAAAEKAARKAEKKALQKAKKEQKKANKEKTKADQEKRANGDGIEDLGFVVDIDGDEEMLEKARDAVVATQPLSKTERKALKKAGKAKKVKEPAVPEEEDEPGQADASEQMKSLKPVVNGNAASIRASSDISSGYTEHAELSGLSASDISSFLESKQITITNSGIDRRPITSFKYLPITEEQRVPFKGFTSPTPIQAAAWPYLLDGRDVVGVAETGSGKTLAFGVPCIRRLSALDSKARKHIKACIVSPTRELALQIQEQLAKFTAPFGLKVTCVYGGVDKDAQRRELKNTQIVVATPGRLNDFIGDGSIDLSHVDYMVLDEADRMLDKGFEEEVRKIVSSTASTGRQTLMFTATWPPSVRDLAGTFMQNPVRINIGDNTTGELRANTRIVQEVEVMEPMQKQDRLIALLKQYQSGSKKNDKILVFCLYKKEATRIEEFIRRKGFNVAGIHGDLSQQKRTESLEAFKQGTVPLLVATDVAARGLDIPAVKLVINVTFPLTAEDYVHRIGRTGRAGQDGKAITFFTDEEKGLAGALINVLKAANQPVPDALLKYGTTVKKKAHDVYGAFYKDTSDMKASTKITFD